MPDRPLLVFPEPTKVLRSKLTGGGGRVIRPDHTRQGERLFPKFNNLQSAFETRKAEVQQSIPDVDPEQVLVLETIGSIEKFANAVRKIEGLEWLGEHELEEMMPDEDFYEEKKPDKELSGRLYLIMTNQRALNELLSLWSRYIDNPELEFEWGLKKFRDIFHSLKDIRRWGVQDRLLETGVIEAWREDLAFQSEYPIRFEAQLWFRKGEEKRQLSEQIVTELVGDLGGRIITQCVIGEISYHAILGELPRGAIREIIDNPSTELVMCDNVMMYLPVGQTVIGREQPDGEPETHRIMEQQPLPTGNPLIAVFDGLPLTNHVLLSERLILDDPDDYSNYYQAQDRVHGTSVASLIIHGDLNDSEDPLHSPVYIRPIMIPYEHAGIVPRPEYIPDDYLPVDLIHRSIRRLFEAEGENEPIAPSIRIINISIGDRSRRFDRSMSPLARLLDWLSYKYNILFIVSAGNCIENLDLEITNEEFDTLTSEEIEEIIVKAILRDGRIRRLVSPAESINSLTVGAMHYDSSESMISEDLVNPFTHLLPSPLSPLGSGYRRSVKPEILYKGGRQLYRKPIIPSNDENLQLNLVNFIRPPGCKVAHPGRQGTLNETIYTTGTSNSTALVSRNAAKCYDVLKEILDTQTTDLDWQQIIIPLLKSIIVHSSNWGDAGDRLRAIIQNNNTNSREIKNTLTRWLGYGAPDFDRVLDCTPQRATLLGFGELHNEEAHIFRLPLPPSLSSDRIWRRLTVTLGYLSPIVPTTHKYRAANVWFDLENDEFPFDRKACDWQTVRRGTIQHEVFEYERAIPLTEGDTIAIKVNCKEEASKIKNPIPYGLVVSFEVAEGVNIPIYEEISTRIHILVQIQQVVGS